MKGFISFIAILLLWVIPAFAAVTANTPVVTIQKGTSGLFVNIGTNESANFNLVSNASD